MENNMPNGFGNIGKKPEDINSSENNTTNNNSNGTPIYQNVNLGNNGSYDIPNGTTPDGKATNGNTYNGNSYNGNSFNANNTNTVKNQYQAKKASEKKTGAFESFIGKNIMGIFASILVIVGLILLVTAASDYITDAIKVVFIYCISFAILAVGLVTNRKQKNGFSMSLAGCGVGAVYISIFLTYGYFHMFNVLIMFVVAAVWSIIVFFIGGRHSAMFHITGQSGLLVSMCFGMAEVLSSGIEQPEIFAIALLFFYICVTVFYAILDTNESRGESVVVFIMNLFGLIFMFATYAMVSAVYEIWQQLTFISVLLGYSFWLSIISYMKFGRPREIKDESGQVVKTVGKGVGWSVYFCFNIVLTCFCLVINCKLSNTPEWVVPLMGLFYVIVSWIFVGLRRKDDGVFIASSIVLMIWTFSFISDLGTVADLFGVGLMALPFLILAMLIKSRTFMILNLISVVVFAFHNTSYPALYVTLMLLFLVTSSFAVLTSDKYKDAGYRVALLGAATVFIYNVAGILRDDLYLESNLANSFAFWIYALLIAICLIITLSAKKKQEGYDFSVHIVLNAMNISAMLVAIQLVNEETTLLLHIINLIVLLGLVSINIPDMVKSKNGTHALYCVIKLTLYAVVAATSFQLDSFVITLVCLMVSIASIVIGFVAERKAIRMYGLILSIVSICKLLLVDISLDSDIMRALLVIGCGIIAFAICLVYNVVTKKIEEENKFD